MPSAPSRIIDAHHHLWDLDRIHYLDLAIDHDPYLFWGSVSGCLTRLSSSALLNVTAGAGSVVPTYIVES